MNDFVEQLKKLHNEDESAWLRQRKEILEYLFASSSQSVKDILYDELNRLGKEIYESMEREKKCT